jgi:hypothetical protein
MGICCCLLDPQTNSRHAARGSAWIVADPTNRQVTSEPNLVFWVVAKYGA